MAKILAMGQAKFVVLSDKVINVAYVIALNYIVDRYKKDEGEELRGIESYFKDLKNELPMLGSGKE